MKPKLMELVKLLADGEWHSGEDLGKTVGVSRAAVSKQLKQAEEYGLAIEKSKGHGYRLQFAIRFLEARVIYGLLSPRCKDILDIAVKPSVGSTSQYLLDLYTTGVDVRGKVCFAEHQNAGRGRRGRTWVSPFGSNLYFSIAWTFSQGVAITEGLSLAVGVAICRALNGLSVQNVTLKWPNDLLFNGRKLGGVLLEMSGDASGDCCIVVGVGLNINMPSVAEIGQPWVDLREITGRSFDRNLIAAVILNEIATVLEGYHMDTFTAYIREWEALNAYCGEAVKVISGAEHVVGRCVGVAENGGLILDVEGKLLTFLGGELSLRKD